MKSSLEDILGTPEEYQAAQKKAADEWAATCARYRGKLLQKSRAEFESLLPPEKLNPMGGDDPDTAMQWNGWQACKDFSPRLKFAKMEIVLPADENERATAIDEFNGMLRAYIGNMCRTWGHDSVVRKGLCDDAEQAAAHARVILTEIEYSNFRIGIVDHGGRSEHRHYKAEK
jgi:hypothetical protein